MDAKSLIEAPVRTAVPAKDDPYRMIPYMDLNTWIDWVAQGALPDAKEAQFAEVKRAAKEAQEEGYKILNAAIDSANLDRVRKVLKEVCTNNPLAFDKACNRLLVNQNSDGSLKRKRPDLNTKHRFEICVHCTSEYDITNNPKDSCTWHEGKHTFH